MPVKVHSKQGLMIRQQKRSTNERFYADAFIKPKCSAKARQPELGIVQKKRFKWSALHHFSLHLVSRRQTGYDEALYVLL